MILVITIFIVLYVLLFIIKCNITNNINTIKYYNNIPNIILRTNKNLHVPVIMHYYCHQKWVNYNPKYNILWYNSKDCDNIMTKYGKRIQGAYLSIKPGAFKADMWRAIMLYEYGGMYIDSYTEPFCSVYEIIKGCINKKNKHHFISALDLGIHNGFIICTPRHPFMKQYILDIVTNIENKFYGKIDLEITGPVCLANSIKKCLKTKKKIKLGWNEFGDLSFYLYKYEKGLYQYISKDGKMVMRKKYSVISLFIQKILNYKSTYYAMWRNKNVYV